MKDEWIILILVLSLSLLVLAFLYLVTNSASPHLSWSIRVPIALTWGFFALPLILLPFDLTNVFRASPLRSPFIEFMWKFYLYMSILFSQLVLPFWGRYIESPHFTAGARVKHSLLDIGKTVLLKLLFVGVCFVAYYFLFDVKGSHPFDDFRTLGVRLLNCVYYFFFLVAFSYGLLKIPLYAMRSLWPRSLRESRETLVGHIYHSLACYAREQGKMSQFFSLLEELKSIYPRKFEEEFARLDSLFDKTQIFAGDPSFEYFDLELYHRRYDFSEKEMLRLHKKVIKYSTRLEQTQSRYYYFLDQFKLPRRAPNSTPLLKKPTLPAPLGPPRFRQTLVFCACTCLSLWLAFLLTLEFSSESSLISVLSHLWASEHSALFPRVLSGVLLVVSGAYTTCTVFFCMIHFNLGHVTGLRLNHRTSLPSLISLSSWLSLFTFPLCYFLVQLVLTPGEYRSSYFFQSLRTSDYLSLWGQPLPHLMIPLVLPLLFFFWFGIHQKLARKVGYYFFGVRESDFGKFSEQEKALFDRPIPQYSPYTQRNSNQTDPNKTVGARIFDFVKRPMSNRIDRVKQLPWSHWPAQFLVKGPFRKMGLEARVTLLGFELDLIEFNSLFMSDFKWYHFYHRRDQEETSMNLSFSV